MGQNVGHIDPYAKFSDAMSPQLRIIPGCIDADNLQIVHFDLRLCRRHDPAMTGTANEPGLPPVRFPARASPARDA